MGVQFRIISVISIETFKEPQQIFCDEHKPYIDRNITRI
jgi:hypothetical protein